MLMLLSTFLEGIGAQDMHPRPSLIERLMGDACNHEAAIMACIRHVFLAFLPFSHPIMTSTPEREHTPIEVQPPQGPLISQRCKSLEVCSNCKADPLQ